MKKKITAALLAIAVACFFGGAAAFGVGSGEENYPSYDNVPLRVEATPDHLIDYVTWYGNTEENDLPDKMFPELTDDFKADTITALYESVPDDLKDNIVLIIVGDGMANMQSYDKMIEFYHRSAKECESLGLPFILQCVNGHTRPDWLIDLSVFEEFAETYSCFAGINAAELYNGPQWRGDLWGDYSDYMAEAVKRMAKYGCQVMWHDTNIFGEDGLFLDWIQGNENLYNTMKAYYKNITIMYKQSYSAPVTEAVIYGLWLNKMIGSFGIASDWWYRQINSVDGVYINTLYDEYDIDGDGIPDENTGLTANDVLNDTWEMIMNYPEAQYGQDMMKAIANGGTSFSQEAQYYSISTYGTRLTAAEKVVYPLMREVENGNLKVPSREDMLEKTKVAFVGRDAYKEDLVFGNRVIGHETSGESLPTDGQYGLIPLLPSNLRLEDKRFFEEQGIELVYTQKPDSYFDAFYEDKTLPVESGETEAYANNVGDTWYFMNHSENKKNATQVARLVPQVNTSEEIAIELDGTSFGYLREEKNRLNFMVSNYVSSRAKFNYETNINIFPSGYYGFLNIYINYWFGVRNQPDGRYGGAADDSLERMGRPTVVRLEGQYKKPIVSFTDYDGADGDSYKTPPYTYTETYDETTGVYELRIMQNGQVNFSIETFSNPLSGKKITLNGEETDVLSDNDPETTAELKAGDEIVIDFGSADGLQRWLITEVDLGNAARSYYTSSNGSSYTLQPSLSAGVICDKLRIRVESDAVLGELGIEGRKFLGNNQELYAELISALKEAKSKNPEIYTADTYALLAEEIAFAEECIGENRYELFDQSYNGLTKCIDELVRSDRAAATSALSASANAVALYVYGESEAEIEISANASAENKIVSYEILSGEDAVSVEKLNNFRYKIVAKDRGVAEIRFYVEGTDAETTVTVNVDFYPITNVAYKKSSYTVGNGQDWTDLLTDGKIDDRYTMPVVINSIEEAVPENVRGNYYVIDLEEAYSLQYIRVHPYLVHKSVYGLIVLVSNDLTFSDPSKFVTVYNADAENVHGFGNGTDPAFYSGANIPVNSEEKFRYVLVTGLGNGWHCHDSPEKWPFGFVQLVEVEVFAEMDTGEGSLEENKVALEELLAEEKAKNHVRGDYENYTFKMYNSAIMRAEVVLSEYEQGASYNSDDFYQCYNELLNWSTKLIDVKAGREVEAKIKALDESYFEPYTYEDFYTEVYAYMRALRVPTRIFDDDFNLVVDDTTMDYRPTLNEGFTDDYVQYKQEEADEAARRMQAALDQLYVDNVDALLLFLGKPTIEKEEQILRILDAYDSLSAEQQAKVQNTKRLEDARKVIDDQHAKKVWTIVGICAGSALVLAAAAFVTVWQVKKRRKAKNSD